MKRTSVMSGVNQEAKGRARKGWERKEREKKKRKEVNEQQRKKNR